jgi:hypothetical protein
LQSLLVVELEIGEHCPKANQRGLLWALSPLLKFIQGVCKPSSRIRIYSLMVLSNIDIVMRPFLPALHVPIIIIRNITLPPAGCKGTQIEVVNAILLAKRLSLIHILAIGLHK